MRWSTNRKNLLLFFLSSLPFFPIHAMHRKTFENFKEWTKEAVKLQACSLPIYAAIILINPANSDGKNFCLTFIGGGLSYMLLSKNIQNQKTLAGIQGFYYSLCLTGIMTIAIPVFGQILGH